MMPSIESSSVFNPALLWGGESETALMGVEGTEGSETITGVKQLQEVPKTIESVPQILVAPIELGLDSIVPAGAEALPEGDQNALETLMSSIASVSEDSSRGRSGNSGGDNSDTPNQSDEAGTLIPVRSASDSDNTSTALFIDNESVGVIQFLLKVLQYDTKREQIDSSVNRLQTDSVQFQSTMAEKLAALEDKIDGKDARLASKVLTWMALIVGALASALTLGALSGPMAIMAGAIGLSVALYSLSQQVAAEATGGSYTVGQEWGMLLEACGMDPEEAEKIAPVVNSVMQVVLSLLGGGLTMGAAAGISSAAGSVSKLGAKLSMVGLGGEAASIATDAGASSSGMVVSSIDMTNGLTDAEVKMLDAALTQMGLTRDQLVAFLQHMMQNLEKMVGAVTEILESWSRANSRLVRPASMA